MAIGTAYSAALPIPNTGAPASSPGEVRLRTDANGNQWKEALLYTPAALQGAITIGAPYYADFSGTAGQNPKFSALAGNPTSGITRQLVIPMSNQQNTGAAPATGTYTWCAFWGTVPVLVDGTTAVAAGDFLKVNSKVVSGALYKDAATQSSLSVGIALAAQAVASAVLTSVYLLGDLTNLA